MVVQGERLDQAFEAYRESKSPGNEDYRMQMALKKRNLEERACVVTLVSIADVFLEGVSVVMLAGRASQADVLESIWKSDRSEEESMCMVWILMLMSVDSAPSLEGASVTDVGVED